MWKQLKVKGLSEHVKCTAHGCSFCDTVVFWLNTTSITHILTSGLGKYNQVAVKVGANILWHLGIITAASLQVSTPETWGVL